MVGGWRMAAGSDTLDIYLLFAIQRMDGWTRGADFLVWCTMRHDTFLRGSRVLWHK